MRSTARGLASKTGYVLLLVAAIAGATLVYSLPRLETVKSVRGVLLDVQSTSPVHAETITLRDEAGRIWTFQVHPDVANNGEEPQSAGHLRQHMALVEPMLVHYRETPDGPVAVRILDALSR